MKQVMMAIFLSRVSVPLRTRATSSPRRPTSGERSIPASTAPGEWRSDQGSRTRRRSRLNFWSGPKEDMVKQAERLLDPHHARPSLPALHYYTLILDGAEVTISAATRSRRRQGTAGARSRSRSQADYYDILEPYPTARCGGLVRLEGDRHLASRAASTSRPITPRRRRRAIRCSTCRHGGGEDETGWIRQGGARNFILDNLIAAGGCKPMIVVMAYGYAGAPASPLPT